MSINNNNKCNQVVTNIKKVGNTLVVEYSEIELVTGKVKKSCKKEIIPLA